MGRWLVFAYAALAAWSCKDSTGVNDVASWTVSPNPIVLVRGDSIQLSASPVNSQGQLVTGIAVSFLSSDTTVASVTPLGKVTGRAKGATVISVIGGGAAAVIRTTVFAPIASIRLLPTDTTIRADATFQLRSAVVDIDGDTVRGQVLQYTSLNSAIAAVDGAGIVRGVGPGTAGIRAQSGNRSAFATVSVLDNSIIARLPLGARPAFIARFGNTAYVSRVDAGRVQVLNLATRSFTDSITVGSVPCGVVFNKAGGTAYVANQYSHNISIIDVASQTVIGTIPVPGDPLPLVMPPRDTVLFVTTNVNKLYKINLRTNEVVDSLPLPATSHHLLAHPKDTLLYVATRDAGSVLEVNSFTMTVVRTFSLGGRTQGMAISPDTSELYVVNELSNTLHIVTLSTGAAANVPLPAGAHSIALSADGTKLYVGLLFAGQIQVRDRATRTLLKTIVTGGVVREMDSDAPRARMTVTNEAGWVDIVR